MKADSNRTINVGICGLGTVGGGTYRLLQQNQAEITRRLGRSLKVTHVASRTEKPDLLSRAVRFSTDVFAVARDPDVDVVVETIGGFEIFARAK